MQFRNCPFQLLIAKYPRESINNSEYITYICRLSRISFIANLITHSGELALYNKYFSTPVRKIELYKCIY